jgi:xanthine dehydrogenase iron-sulfur cluster and FAD-binding subunit A
MHKNCFAHFIFQVHSGEVSAQLTLAQYLRDHLGLTGTKVTCAQAGCGACIVTAEIADPTTGEWIVKSVNSVSKQCQFLI